MKLRNGAIFLILVAQTGVAKEACEVPNYVKNSWRNYADCHCPTKKEINNFSEKVPYNFKIDAVCDIYSGTYYLSGKVVVHGELKKSYSEEMGDVITFDTPKRNSVFSDFMFDRNIDEDKIFSMPKYMNKINCIKAPATLLINSLLQLRQVPSRLLCYF
jgi:hypothetical protein